MQEKQDVIQLAQRLYDRKAWNIVALDVAHLTVITESMLIASGSFVNQVRALADEVEETAAEMGLTLHRKEGLHEGRWVILDFGHVLVHIMHREEREYYHLERLWEDGTNKIALPFDQTQEIG